VDEKHPQIRLVAGLGNPGAEYAHTRHNIGFMIVDLLAHEAGLNWEKSSKWEAATAKFRGALLVKPASYMNRSGHPLHAIAQFFKITPQGILVVLDDFSLPLGRLRIRRSGGPGGHNGLESIIMQFGTEEIPRLRAGIGPAPAEGATDYVLSNFFKEEKDSVRSTINRAAEAVKCAIDKGIVSAMNTFNPEGSPQDESVRSADRVAMPRITVDLVRALVPLSRAGVIFELSNALAARDLQLALTVVRRLLDQGESAIGILLAAIVPTVRNLLLAKDLLERHRLAPPRGSGGPFHFISTLNRLPESATKHLPRKKDGSINAYALGMAAQNAHLFETGRLVAGMQACLDANLRLVTTQLNHELILTEVVVKLIGAE
jgi:peptidyl-tRNA hydrolase, PTH1 family